MSTTSTDSLMAQASSSFSPRSSSESEASIKSACLVAPKTSTESPEPQAAGAAKEEVAEADPEKMRLESFETERTRLHAPIFSVSEADQVSAPNSASSFVSWSYNEDEHSRDWAGPIPPGQVMHKDFQEAISQALAGIRSDQQGFVHKVERRRMMM